MLISLIFFFLMQNCKIHHSVVGLRSCISEGAIIEDTLLMGADYYEVILHRELTIGYSLIYVLLLRLIELVNPDSILFWFAYCHNYVFVHCIAIDGCWQKVFSCKGKCSNWYWQEFSHQKSNYWQECSYRRQREGNYQSCLFSTLLVWTWMW